MKINYKDYVIEIDNNKSTSKKELYKTIHDAILEIDNIIKKDNNFNLNLQLQKSKCNKISGDSCFLQ